MKMEKKERHEEDLLKKNTKRSKEAAKPVAIINARDVNTLAKRLTSGANNVHW